jgi:hypothetical protein
MTRGVLIAATGLILVLWGLPAAHRLTRRTAVAAACAFVLGVALLLLGTLLMAVPGFFGG